VIEDRPTFMPVNYNLSLLPRPNITALGDLLSDFMGAEDTFVNWHRQLKLVRTTYNLDDNSTRILISMKLKKRALQWFHSKPEHLEVSVNELLDHMKRMFDHRPTKMDLRRRFEKRSWRNDEFFSDYYYDKVILAGKTSVDENELIDFIIDGIPEGYLRNQARMQCFGRKEDLLKAFAQITLRSEGKNRPGRGNAVFKPDNRQSDNKQQLKTKEAEQDERVSVIIVFKQGISRRIATGRESEAPVTNADPRIIGFEIVIRRSRQHRRQRVRRKQRLKFQM